MRPKKGSLKWLWISLAIVGVIVIGLIGLAFKTFSDLMNAAQLVGQAPVALLEDRKGNETEWLDPDEVDFESDGEAPAPRDE
ncbi:MAG: hypothetical protein ACKVJU_09215 [Verrucomicrobiales bacterium]